MQFKDQNQQNQPNQKGKKNIPVQQQHDTHGIKIPSQTNLPSNPQVPTKDKNVPRPPIFGKRE